MEKGRERWKELGGGEGLGERGQERNCVMKIVKLLQFVLWL